MKLTVVFQRISIDFRNNCCFSGFKCFAAQDNQSDVKLKTKENDYKYFCHMQYVSLQEGLTLFPAKKANFILFEF